MEERLQFEKELDDYFKERAQFRTRHFTDDSKIESADARASINPFERDQSSKQQATANVKSNVNCSASNLSGCCMSGCFDCPWSYENPEQA